MARPEPHQLDPGRYPFMTEVDVRFSDIDVNRHINNVSLSNFVEEGRVRFHRASGYHSAIAGIGSMVASIGIEYVGQAYYPGTLEIRAGASQVGRTSFELELLITQDGRPVVFARSVMVCTREGKPFPIPDSFRDAVAGEWGIRA
ncbi:MAG: acyl-CoA thioesterase [Novosphingobium sp.]